MPDLFVPVAVGVVSFVAGLSAGLRWQGVYRDVRYKLFTRRKR